MRRQLFYDFTAFLRFKREALESLADEFLPIRHESRHQLARLATMTVA